MGQTACATNITLSTSEVPHIPISAVHVATAPHSVERIGLTPRELQPLSHSGDSQEPDPEQEPANSAQKQGDGRPSRALPAQPPSTLHDPPLQATQASEELQTRQRQERRHRVGIPGPALEPSKRKPRLVDGQTQNRKQGVYSALAGRKENE
jgi:hypothetical protein